MRCKELLVFALPTLTPIVMALELNVNDHASVENAASKVVAGLMNNWFKGQAEANTAGFLLPAPWFWWEAGELWTGLINYWSYTGQTTYLSQTHQFLEAQIGRSENFLLDALVQNQIEANDDQSHWAFAAMTAAEKNFPAPNTGITWVQTVKNVWSFQVAQWDATRCNGGLSWGFQSWDYKYGYKNAITNGAFFQISARLALHTGETLYRDWAQTTWNWATSSGMVTPDYHVQDGIHVDHCVNTPTPWSINHGIFLHGAASMYKLTGSQEWRQRVDGLLKTAQEYYFTSPGGRHIMWEPDCDWARHCDNDATIFKASMVRSMYETARLAPHTSGTIFQLLGNTAVGAANACTGQGGILCGTQWYEADDEVYSPGTQLSALEVIQGMLLAPTSSYVQPHDDVPPAETAPVENPPTPVDPPPEPGKEYTPEVTPEVTSEVKPEVTPEVVPHGVPGDKLEGAPTSDSSMETSDKTAEPTASSPSGRSAIADVLKTPVGLAGIPKPESNASFNCRSNCHDDKIEIDSSIDIPDEKADSSDASKETKDAGGHHKSNNTRSGPSFVMGVFCVAITFWGVLYVFF